MKRTERTDYTYLKNSLKKGFCGQGAVLTIAVNAGQEFKLACHNLFTSHGFHPCGIVRDTRRFDDQERILYIQTIDADTDWTELYSQSEREAFEAALNC